MRLEVSTLEQRTLAQSEHEETVRESQGQGLEILKEKDVHIKKLEGEISNW